MKFELKAVKYLAANSEETHCFAAKLYVDGKFSTEVSNAGHGGCNSYSNYDAVDRIDKRLNKEIIKTEFGDLKNNLEIVVGNLMNDYLADKQLKTILRRISFINSGQLYQYPAKIKPIKHNLEAIKKRPDFKKDSILLNELPFDQALAHVAAL